MTLYCCHKTNQTCVVCVRLSRVGCSVSVRDFRSSWRSGEAFLAILCSLRPQLVDLSLVRSRSNQENLEEAFLLAERELHIPRLLEPHGEAPSQSNTTNQNIRKSQELSLRKSTNDSDLNISMTLFKMPVHCHDFCPQYVLI